MAKLTDNQREYLLLIASGEDPIGAYRSAYSCAKLTDEQVYKKAYELAKKLHLLGEQFGKYPDRSANEARKTADNIIPYQFEPESEAAREAGAAGGRASGVARREKASLQKAAKLLLSLDCQDDQANDIMDQMGLKDGEKTNADMITTAMILRASRGDTKAFEAIAKVLPMDDTATGTSEAQVIPHFDISAHIAPVYCNVSWAIEEGINEIILKGGRGSAKSSYVYTKALDVFLSRPHAQALCTRRYSNTLRNSCYANMLWAITKRGMTYGRAADPVDFVATVSPMEIVHKATGNRIIFAGSDDPGKIKSITFPNPKAKVEILILEEYNQLDGPEAARSVEQSVFRGDFALEFKLFNPSPDECH